MQPVKNLATEFWWMYGLGCPVDTSHSKVVDDWYHLELKGSGGEDWLCVILFLGFGQSLKVQRCTVGLESIDLDPG